MSTITIKEKGKDGIVREYTSDTETIKIDNNGTLSEMTLEQLYNTYKFIRDTFKYILRKDSISLWNLLKEKYDIEISNTTDVVEEHKVEESKEPEAKIYSPSEIRNIMLDILKESSSQENPIPVLDMSGILKQKYDIEVNYNFVYRNLNYIKEHFVNVERKKFRRDSEDIFGYYYRTQ